MWWLLACTEYQVAPEPEAPAPAELRVRPEAVALEGVCGEEAVDVVLENRGGSPLTVQAVEVAGDGWVAATDPLPASIAAGQALNVEVRGSAGLATLTLTTDDPTTPVVEVPLSATANEAPVVYVTAPYEGQVLDPAAPFTLVGLVKDAETAPEALTAQWRTNRVGVLVDAAPDADGRVETPWPEALRTPGPVVVELVITDACGAAGEASMYACQDGEWTVESLAADVWLTEGAAVVDQGAATLSLGPAAGAGFDGYLTFDAERFAAEFDVVGAGAGFALALLDPARATQRLGGEGCALGLGPDGCVGAGLPGWAVVFDTLAGDGNDCGAPPTVSLVVDGDLGAPLACAPLPTGFAGGAVRVAADAGVATVSLDGVEVLRGELPDAAVGTAYAGFTGVGDWTVHGLRLTDSQCDAP